MLSSAESGFQPLYCTPNRKRGCLTFSWTLCWPKWSAPGSKVAEAAGYFHTSQCRNKQRNKQTRGWAQCTPVHNRGYASRRSSDMLVRRRSYTSLRRLRYSSSLDGLAGDRKFEKEYLISRHSSYYLQSKAAGHIGFTMTSKCRWNHAM